MEGPLQIGGQPDLHSDLQESLNYKETCIFNLFLFFTYVFMQGGGWEGGWICAGMSVGFYRV